jgi:hypothetical protein
LKGKFIEFIKNKKGQEGFLFEKKVIAKDIIDLRLVYNLQLEKKKKYKVKVK